MGHIIRHHHAAWVYDSPLVRNYDLEFHLKVAHDLDLALVDDVDIPRVHEADHFERANLLDPGRRNTPPAPEPSTVAPSDDEVEENIANALGPVKFGQWQLRTFSCPVCRELVDQPATDYVMERIADHARATHAETLLP